LLRSSFPASTTASRPFILKQSKPVCILSQFEAIAPDSLCHLSKYRCTLNLPNQSKQHPAPALGILPLITTIKQTQQHSSSSSKNFVVCKAQNQFISFREKDEEREGVFLSMVTSASDPKVTPPHLARTQEFLKMRGQGRKEDI